MPAYLEAGVGTVPPPSARWGPPAPQTGAPAPGCRAAGTAVHLWRGRPLWSSGGSTPHQSPCSPEGHHAKRSQEMLKGSSSSLLSRQDQLIVLSSDIYIMKHFEVL